MGLAIDHQDPIWLMCSRTCRTPRQQLGDAGDRRRRAAGKAFPQDALDYYGYALQRGGKQVELLNKIGVTELEMRHVALARVYFQRVVKLKKKNSEGWNNLGAVEYLDGRYRGCDRRL